MKSSLWLVASPVLLVLGAVSLFHSLQGTVGFNFGYPLSANTFEISGKAAGGWVLATLLLEAAGIIAFLIGVIGAVSSRNRAGGPLASPATNAN